MARINLLPWREEQRKRRRDEFLAILVLAVLVAAGMGAGAHYYYDGLIQQQTLRNQFLEKEIAALAEEIKEIAKLDRDRQRLIDRIRAIEQLQAERPGIVRLFDAVVETLPEGVSLTAFQQKDRTLTFNGIARSNARVSNYMKRIEKSEVISPPTLQVIETRTRDGQRYADFQLKASQIVEAVSAEGAPGRGATGGKP
jgi:type IV pilus assembly protein PilN